jgi:integrase
MQRFPLGKFPAMGVSEARSEARAMYATVRTGADPVADRRRDRAIGQDAKAGIGTLAAVLDIYEAHKGKSLKSWVHGRKRVDRVVKPLMSRPVATLTAADLQMAADAYSAEQSAAIAVRTIRPALKWAARRNHVDPALAELQAPATVKARKRTLSREELARVLPVLRVSGKPHSTMIRFLLLTLARLNEAAGARWRDIHMTAATWTIAETKNGQVHVVPLSRQVLDLLRTLRSASDGPAALVFASSAGTPLGNWDRETKALQSRSGTVDWHRHDLRRTGATMLGDMGELPDIIEAALNHVSIRSPLAAAYNRSRYRPQVAQALQRLADALDDIEAGAAKEVSPRA